MNYTADELLAISDMLTHAKIYNLEVECVWSALSEVASMARDGKAEDIKQACENALADWDI